MSRRWEAGAPGQSHRPCCGGRCPGGPAGETTAPGDQGPAGFDWQLVIVFQNQVPSERHLPVLGTAPGVGTPLGCLTVRGSEVVLKQVLKWFWCQQPGWWRSWWCPRGGLGASASSVTFWALTWVLVTPVCSCCENPSCFIPEIDTIFRVCAELHLKV